MRTIIYVDGFNLYYRLLKGRPQFKWLNIKALAETVLSDGNDVVGVKYFTADISGRFDPDAPRRQRIYLNALSTVPGFSIHKGMFLTSKVFAGLVHPPDFRPEAELAEPWPNVVRVIKTEEKGSDVNLATHLLVDAFKDRYDVAAVLSNDSDLVEPIRMVSEELGKVVGLLSPVKNPNPELQAVASFVRRIRNHHLTAAQFPNRIPDTDITRPGVWQVN